MGPSSKGLAWGGFREKCGSAPCHTGEEPGTRARVPGCFGKGSVQIAPVYLEHLCGFYYSLCSWNYIFFQTIEIKTFVVVVVSLLVFNF